MIIKKYQAKTEADAVEQAKKELLTIAKESAVWEMLVVVGLITGGRFTRVTLTGVLLLLGLITISMVGFILYNQLICYNPISEIAIFNALIPVFGTMMSCLMLDETFGMSNLLGLLCTSFGIFMIHFKRKGKTKEC